MDLPVHLKFRDQPPAYVFQLEKYCYRLEGKKVIKESDQDGPIPFLERTPLRETKINPFLYLTTSFISLPEGHCKDGHPKVFETKLIRVEKGVQVFHHCHYEQALQFHLDVEKALYEAE